MAAYLIRKLLLAVPLVAGVLLLVFALVELSPGDACDAFLSPEMDPRTIAQVRATFGCDLPLLARFAKITASLATLDLGISVSQQRPVVDILLEAAPNTLLLAGVTILIAQAVGCSVGVAQAVWHRRPQDTGLSLVTLFFYSMPHFWLALMLVLLLSPPFPTSGMVDPVAYDSALPLGKLADRLHHLVLPGAAMGLASAAGDARFMRSAMLEVLHADYVRTARAKGLPEHVVVLKHALRNALLPMITLLGLNLPHLFSGAVLVETVFAWPGMGRVITGAIFTQDVPLLTGCFLVFTLLVVAGNLLADVLYAVADPRIRYA